MAAGGAGTRGGVPADETGFAVYPLGGTGREARRRRTQTGVVAAFAGASFPAVAPRAVGGGRCGVVPGGRGDLLAVAFPPGRTTVGKGIASD